MSNGEILAVVALAIWMFLPSAMLLLVLWQDIRKLIRTQTTGDMDNE